RAERRPSAAFSTLGTPSYRAVRGPLASCSRNREPLAVLAPLLTSLRLYNDGLWWPLFLCLSARRESPRAAQVSLGVQRAVSGQTSPLREPNKGVGSEPAHPRPDADAAPRGGGAVPANDQSSGPRICRAPPRCYRRPEGRVSDSE